MADPGLANIAAAIQRGETALNTLRRRVQTSIIRAYTQMLNYHGALANLVNHLENIDVSYHLGNRLEDIEDVTRRKNIMADMIIAEPVIVAISHDDVIAVAEVRVNALNWQVRVFPAADLPQEIRDNIREFAIFLEIDVTDINPFP